LNRLQHFIADLLEQEGAVVEPIKPEGLEVLAPPSLRHILDLPELSRLGFGTELPKGAQRISLESDWIERLADLLGERGGWQRQVLDLDIPMPGSPERILRHGLELANATYRLQDVQPVWTRYIILTFRYTALADEKRDDILLIGFNLANGATLDEQLKALLASLPEMESGTDAEPPEDVQLPPLWERQRLNEILQRALPARVSHRLDHFLRSMRRRQERDLTRLYNYHNDLRREALERLAALPPNGQLSARQQASKDREQLRLQAIAREYMAKVNDLRQKHAMKIELEWVQTLELIMPVQRFRLLIKRRKGERLFNLDWNPITRKLDQAPCEYSYTWEPSRMVCDEVLHLVSLAAHAPCPQCGKEYCRACHPRQCPKCHRQVNELIPLQMS
jgi:hypothetical protein